ncbi:MAG: Vms1/Ankzf1 family peptidyl-tRNA hydrolase [Chloroflexi bacterium]|nr:Vms1/Ankzf1 family peptidyl-tRNA hydrolase [Chloroflexota bacterium]
MMQDVPIQLLRRLAEQWQVPERDAYTYCLPPTLMPPDDVKLPDETFAAIQASETGAILFWSPGETRLVLPPFPVESEAAAPGWEMSLLWPLLERRWTVLVPLLRMSGFAVGIFEGERLALSKTGTRFVKGRHKKGGSSSARFARRREDQARMLFDKAAETLQELVEAYTGSLTHLIFGGDRLTLLAFEKRCPFLQRLEVIRLRRILNVERPSLNALKELPRQIYMSRVGTFGADMRSEPD